MKAKKIIVIVVATLMLGGGILAFCLTRGDTAPDTPPEPIETEDTEPITTEPVIPIIEDDKNKEETPIGTEKAEVIVDIAEYDNGHSDAPSVVGEVFIAPGYKEVDE